MKTQSFSKLFMYVALCCMLVFTIGLMSGCKGSDGSTGATGPQGPEGQQGPPGPGIDTIGTVDAKTFTFDDLRNIPLGGTIISAAVTSNHPVVTFQVVNAKTNEGIRGLGTFSLHIAQLKPEANGSNSYWLNYILNSTNRPTTDAASTFNADGTVNVQGYSVVDHNDGTYTVTFGKDITTTPSVTYDPTLTHRIVVGVRSVAVPGIVGETPGAYAGPINPITGATFAQFTNTNGVNFAYDFVPSTGTALAPARDIVTVGACNQCHYKIQYGSIPLGNNTSGHFGSRTDTKTCVMCHTPQNVVSGQTATTNVNFTPFIHKIHMGERLPAPESNLTGTFEGTYPQDIRNCNMCHKGTDGDNWKNKPTRIACGSCHNDVSFVSPVPAGLRLHTGGAKADDSGCKLCHDAPTIESYHVPVAPPDPTDPRMGLGGTNTHTNAEYIAAAGAVPTGASRYTWVVSSVTKSGSNPSIKFKFQKDGTDVVFTAPTSTASELFANVAGSPSAYFVWAEPQDGITKPADFNKSASAYIRNVWNGTISSATATITGPDASGFYTLTRTGTTIPANAVMLTGGIGYSYGSATPPLVQTNVTAYPYTAASGTGGLSVPSPNVWKVATGYTGRRVVVDTNKCNSCHQGLGVEPTFHVGQRNDAPTCSFCHNPGRASQGWTVNASTFVHAIHGPAKRTVDFKWDSVAATADEPETGFFDITYPGVLKNCEQCHVAGGYDFSGSMYTANSGAQGVANMLLSTTATGTSLASSSTSSASFSPYVTLDVDYGAAGASTNLVNSPIAAACFACHDSDLAKDHMVLNGGSLWDTRANALTRTETCLICHGPASNTAFGDFVPAIKSVHRWW